MRDGMKTSRIEFGFLLILALFAVGPAKAQTSASGELRTERIKVPAVTHASYSEPEAPPTFEEIRPVNNGPYSRQQSARVASTQYQQPMNPQMTSGDVVMESVG